jgi:putative membrane protein
MHNSLKFISAIMIALFLGYSCNRDNAASDAKQAAEDRNDAKFTDKASKDDAQFVVDAYSAGLVEINMAQRAKELAVTSEAKSTADMMISAHTQMNADLAALADKKVITVPSALNDNQTKEINSLAEKKGRDFDEAFADKLVSSHKDAVSLFEKASTTASDQDIRNLFSTNLPTIRQHLDMATNLQDQLK